MSWGAGSEVSRSGFFLPLAHLLSALLCRPVGSHLCKKARQLVSQGEQSIDYQHAARRTAVGRVQHPRARQGSYRARWRYSQRGMPPPFDRGKVERFATLPPGEAYPEGIDADADGNVYVVTVGVNKPDTSAGSLFVFDPNGKLLRTVHTEGTSPWLLDLRFQPNTGKLLVVDYKNPKVFTVDPKTGATSVFMTVTGEHPGLDGLTFDADGMCT
jgi:hypothetical protein